MKVVYIAGPFRAPNAWEIEQNIRHAEELALQVWRAGFAVICPHTNTRFFQGAAPDAIWLDGDIEILKRCDAVVIAQPWRWRTSKGTVAEVREALTRSIPVFRTLTDLLIWHRSGNLDYAILAVAPEVL